MSICISKDLYNFILENKNKINNLNINFGFCYLNEQTQITNINIDDNNNIMFQIKQINQQHYNCAYKTFFKDFKLFHNKEEILNESFKKGWSNIILYYLINESDVIIKEYIFGHMLRRIAQYPEQYPILRYFTEKYQSLGLFYYLKWDDETDIKFEKEHPLIWCINHNSIKSLEIILNLKGIDKEINKFDNFATKWAIQNANDDIILLILNNKYNNILMKTVLEEAILSNKTNIIEYVLDKDKRFLTDENIFLKAVDNEKKQSIKYLLEHKDYSNFIKNIKDKEYIDLITDFVKDIKIDNHFINSNQINIDKYNKDLSYKLVVINGNKHPESDCIIGKKNVLAFKKSINYMIKHYNLFKKDIDENADANSKISIEEKISSGCLLPEGSKQSSLIENENIDDDKIFKDQANNSNINNNDNINNNTNNTMFDNINFNTNTNLLNSINSLNNTNSLNNINDDLPLFLDIQQIFIELLKKWNIDINNNDIQILKYKEYLIQIQEDYNKFNILINKTQFKEKWETVINLLNEQLICIKNELNKHIEELLNEEINKLEDKTIFVKKKLNN